MRWSLRRAADTSVILFLLGCMCFIIFTDYSFDFQERKISFESFRKKDGVSKLTKREVPVDLVQLRGLYRSHTRRKQRSAKSVNENVEDLKFQRVTTTTKDEKVTLMKPEKITQLRDIFIGVKTTKNFHSTRLKVQLETWIGFVREQTYIFTDGNDTAIQNLVPKGHFVNTKCSDGHTRKALSCKMAVEYDYFIDSGKRWFCHVDDDNYINIPQLLYLLRKYNYTADWYIGKPSLQRPIEIMDKSTGQKLAFWFATGGAGFCISKALAFKMVPYAGGGRFKKTSEFIRLPDDCTIGYIINYILNTQLTIHPSFHSHLEPLNFIKDIEKQVTFSYTGLNRVQVPKARFPRSLDNTRFKSIHCHLFPNTNMCTSAVR